MWQRASLESLERIQMNSSTQGGSSTSNNNNTSTTSKRKGPCHWCRLPEHFERECRKKMNGEPRKPPPESHLLTSGSKPSVLVVCSVHSERTPYMWFLDSGASHHVCYSRQHFHEYNPVLENTFLIVGNNSRVSVKGTGSVSLITPQNLKV